MENLIEYIKSLAPFFMTLVSLIILDVLLGIAVAIRKKWFSWRELGDFYLTMVIPFIIGWLALGIVSQVASLELLGPEWGSILGGGITGFAWLAIVAVIGNSIIRNGKFLYGSFPFGPQEPDTIDERLDSLEVG